MAKIAEIPELVALDSRAGLIRIPDQLDVPVTARVRHIIDSVEFRRLNRISQLGLVGLVYPAAHHTRFEHSLGVYRMALLFLRRLACDRRFCEIVSPGDAELFLVSALLHDLGHWPFCHPIEDIHLPGVPQHELFANSFLLEGEIADVLRHDWKIQPREIITLLSEKPRDPCGRLLASMLSGPIDVDKLDYLMRDSLHAGVPYGRNFDQDRLIGSLCVNAAGDGIAISEKGRTAAEMLVFARYVMFSEVYWHHSVRAATAMLQRAFFLLYERADLDQLFRLSEREMVDHLLHLAERGPAVELLEGLFGPKRRIYKRLAQFSVFQQPEIYRLLARRPYRWLVACGEALTTLLSRKLGRRVAPHEILFDAPPEEREVEFNIDVYFPKEDLYRPLGDVSPVVKTLALQQFDDYVKRVRVFAHGEIVQQIQRQVPDLSQLLTEAVSQVQVS